ncbi:MAG: hypothetical protein ACUVQ8_05345 [Nitrososphaeria archaeon]
MTHHIIEENILLKDLSLKAGITKKQLTYLIADVSGERGERLREKIMRTCKKNVSKSSYVITRERGRKRIRRALYTLIIAYYLGLITSDCFANLEKASLILNGAKGKELSADQATSVLTALDHLVRKMMVTD